MSKTVETSSSAREGLDVGVVRKAAAALLKHVAKVQASKPTASLVDDTEYVHLVVGMRRIPDKSKNKPYRISIPHSLYCKEEPRLCLFVKDPSTAVEEELEKTPVEGFAKVMSYSTLRKNYTRYKDRRQLCSSYDAFFSDDRILPMMPRLLGKEFFNKKKHPIPVRVSRSGTLKHVLERARDSTYLYMGWGPCTAIKVGRTDFTVDELVDNITAAMAGAVERIPKGWKAIQVIHLKSTSTTALPIFHSLPELHGADDAHIPAIPAKRAATGAGAGAGAGADDAGGDSDASSSILGGEVAEPVATPKPAAKAKKSGGARTTGQRKGKKRAGKRFFDGPASAGAKVTRVQKKRRTKQA